MPCDVTGTWTRHLTRLSPGRRAPPARCGLKRPWWGLAAGGCAAAALLAALFLPYFRLDTQDEDFRAKAALSLLALPTACALERYLRCVQLRMPLHNGLPGCPLKDCPRWPSAPPRDAI